MLVILDMVVVVRQVPIITSSNNRSSNIALVEDLHLSSHNKISHQEAKLLSAPTYRTINRLSNIRAVANNSREIIKHRILIKL